MTNVNMNMTTGNEDGMEYSADSPISMSGQILNVRMRQPNRAMPITFFMEVAQWEPWNGPNINSLHPWKNTWGAVTPFVSAGKLKTNYVGDADGEWAIIECDMSEDDTALPGLTMSWNLSLWANYTGATAAGIYWYVWENAGQWHEYYIWLDSAWEGDDAHHTFVGQGARSVDLSTDGFASLTALYFSLEMWMVNPVSGKYELDYVDFA